MDYECAEDILRASSNMDNHKPGTEEILTKYGKERAGRVVAAMINNAPADKYSEHREWASRIGNALTGEPSVRNVEIFQRHESINIFHAFIQAFRRIAESMINTLFTVTDKNGKKISKSSWALPKEIAKSKPEEKVWDEGLSAKERLAVAEQMAAEHNRNRREVAPRKNNNRSGLDL
jgi:hypothetical protein